MIVDLGGCRQIWKCSHFEWIFSIFYSEEFNPRLIFPTGPANPRVLESRIEFCNLQVMENKRNIIIQYVIASRLPIYGEAIFANFKMQKHCLGLKLQPL
ncbi:hypothetical protein DA792_14035 [Celeribacter baekdonensis]|uniref:Uncharacterized protein n=1 Tax=Celeribacter baekdonensis TaxID=875171 RepID=A0A2R4M4M1_9RHOB|nr:hypothetical protein DA792_14035 [Celeribacter baekdonensis]